MQQLVLVFLFLFGVQQLHGLFLNLQGKESYCLYKDVPSTQKLYISYVVSGKGEEKITFIVFQESRFTQEDKEKKWAIKPKFIITGQRDFEYKIMVEEDQEFRICFKSEDGQNKTVSFDFILEETMVKDNDDIRALTLQSLKKNHRKLEKILQNQHYQYVRDSVHSQKIVSMTNKIKWCSLLKIFVLILMCGFQAYFLKQFLKTKSANILPQTMME